MSHQESTFSTSWIFEVRIITSTLLDKNDRIPASFNSYRRRRNACLICILRWSMLPEQNLSHLATSAFQILQWKTNLTRRDSASPTFSPRSTIVCILSVTVCAAGDLKVLFVKLFYPSKQTPQLAPLTPACLKLSTSWPPGVYFASQYIQATSSAVTLRRTTVFRVQRVTCWPSVLVTQVCLSAVRAVNTLFGSTWLLVLLDTNILQHNVFKSVRQHLGKHPIQDLFRLDKH